MTREELRDYVEEQRNLDIIPYHVYSTLIDGIDTLEQESVLDKIRAEIEQLPTSLEHPDIEYIYGVTKKQLLEIIDKYKTES